MQLTYRFFIFSSDFKARKVVKIKGGGVVGILVMLFLSVGALAEEPKN
jgi:hypothetical protein